jgi:hypothetical protein
MPEQEHDAIVEIHRDIARVHTLSTPARQWIESHVTLEQVDTWTGSLLEVAPHYIGDLIAGMLADGLKVATTHGNIIEDRDQCGSVLFMTSTSWN